MFELQDFQFKPEWMKPPAWRWLVLMDYLADPTKKVGDLQFDPFLYEGAQFYRDRKAYITNKEYYYKKYPEISLAFDLYLDSSPGSWRWILEALCMTDMDDAGIVKLLKIDCPVGCISAFRQCFFDISSYRDSEVAVNANILSTSRLCINQELDCDFTWKYFSYVWGADAFVSQLSGKKSKFNRKYKDWFKELTFDNFSLYSFQLTNNMRLLYNSKALEILNSAKSFFDITEEGLGKAEDLAKSDFLRNVAGHVNVCLMNSKQKCDEKIEKRVAIDYSALASS